MNKAVFLDRDGTINIEKNYLYKIEDFEYTDGCVQALIDFQNKGFLLFVITNQSGIGRGLYTEEDFHKLNMWMISDLKKKGVNITKTYFCPHHPNAVVDEYRVDCNCRKPLLGMYFKAVEEYDIDLSKSFSIGDRISDCAISKTTDCKSILIGNFESNSTIFSVINGEVHNTIYRSTLFECIGVIK